MSFDARIKTSWHANLPIPELEQLHLGSRTSWKLLFERVGSAALRDSNLHSLFYTGGIAIMLSAVTCFQASPFSQGSNLHLPFGHPPGSHGPNPGLVFSAFPFATGPAYLLGRWCQMWARPTPAGSRADTRIPQGHGKMCQHLPCFGIESKYDFLRCPKWQDDFCCQSPDHPATTQQQRAPQSGGYGSRTHVLKTQQFQGFTCLSTICLPRFCSWTNTRHLSLYLIWVSECPPNQPELFARSPPLTGEDNGSRTRH